jgi:dipeptidase
MSSQSIEGAAFYPYSVKPEKKLSVRDVIAFQRSVYKDTIYNMAADHNWLVPDGNGGYVKSPLATPFPSADLRKLLGVAYHRPIARHGYGMVAQLRDWLPDPIGGVYWFYVDNPYVSTYVPIYAGVQETHPYYKTYDARKFSDDSARWAVDFVDNLLHLKWQVAVKDLWAVRDPMEAGFFEKQAAVEEEALALHEKDVKKANKFLTDLTQKRMEEIVEMYRELRRVLITKYTNNTY